MDPLPKKWARCEIGEVTRIVSGGTPPSKDSTNFAKEGGIPWITPADLSGYKNIYISRGTRNLTEKGLRACSATILPKGSVLFSSRAPVGYVAIAANELTTNQGFKSFILPNELNSRYVYFYLRYIKPLAEVMATGTTFKELSGSNAARLPLIIAPLNEQKRIADKLDSLLSKVGNCQERLERVPKILKSFRKAILAAATSGRLTELWRKEQGLRLEDWDTTYFEDVCNEITVGYVGKMVSEYRDKGIPFLRSLNVRPFRFDPQDLKYISPEFHQTITKSSLQPGDVVVVRSGAPGQCCVVPAELSEANCSDLVIIRTGPRLLPDFACVFINSEESQSFVRQEQVGVAQAHFNVGSMKKAPLQLPSIDEQLEIVYRVKKLFSYTDRIESRYQEGKALTEQLMPSLLAKAFRGELVSHDPIDEPASVLLEHIRVGRVKQPEKRKRVLKSKEPRETTMNKDSVKEFIHNLPDENFKFDDLRDKFPGDYEKLKDILFSLLSEREPSITQLFDPSTQTICFIRRAR